VASKDNFCFTFDRKIRAISLLPTKITHNPCHQFEPVFRRNIEKPRSRKPPCYDAGSFAGKMRMNRSKLMRIAIAAMVVLSVAVGMAQNVHTPYDPDLLAETLRENNRGFDFDRREEMIPMRDGVHLFTVILIPRVEEKMPIMLTRTPYGASMRVPPDKGPQLGAALPLGDDIFAGSHYIRVFQDVRGKYRSEGKYVMNMPLRGPLNTSGVDHSTDTYDTIDWLVHNIPQNNGRVGMIGTSYDGFLVLMGLINPHPALKAAVPINPMVDTWIGDDWFHNGAFREMMMDFIYNEELTRDFTGTADDSDRDQYNVYLHGESAGNLGRSRGLDQVSFWKSLVMHPAYDQFWQGQALDKILAGQPLKVPTMYIHGLWDQEDMYGALAAYEATEPKDKHNDLNYLVIGPWSHGGSNGNGSYLGPLKFDGDTALHFRRTVLLPFLDEHLRADGPKADTPPVLAYETGTNTWHRYEAWPVSCETACKYKMKSLYLKPGMQLGFAAAASNGAAYAEYVSDPEHPVPYSARPVRPVYSRSSTWGRWLVEDQRNLANRQDVLSYRSEVLTQPLELSGQPIANLFASTSGTDADFIVKLIDVYPDQNPSEPELAGYQLMVSADIFRGRYRNGLSHPTPIPEGKVELYRWTLPAVSHAFLPGHRIMVQIQSSWYPLYDRNPQTYVENIFFAKPGDYRKATQRIYQTGASASFIDLPVVH
jgi:putative CocE/NonD family hydrolase